MKTVEHLNALVRSGMTSQAALDALNQETGINSSVYPGGLVVLNYDQIASPKKHPMVVECRGLILHVNDHGKFEVVSRSFDRFFNLGECEEHKDITCLKEHHVFEKVDGSLIRVYRHQHEWHIATRGTAFAESGVNGFDVTFRSLFLRAAGLSEVEFQNAMDNTAAVLRRQMVVDGLTFIFELATRENRVVTPYSEDQLVLIGARWLNGEEQDLFGLSTICEIMAQYGHINVRMPRVWELNSIEEIKKAVAELGGLQEGFVVSHKYDISRFKLKSAAYLVAHHIRNNGTLTPNRVAELIVTGEHVEYLTYFPEDMRFFEEMIKAYDQLLLDIPFIESRAKEYEDQKSFALMVKDYPFSDALFRGRKTNTPALQCFLAKDTMYKVKVLQAASKS